jgi:LysM repeat protein
MRFLAPAAFVMLALAACSPAAAETVAPFPTQTLLLYSTPTLQPTVPFGANALPTATPRVYVIEEGDTLFGIAALNALTVDQLLAANPGVNPLLLSPGTSLVIPQPSADGTVVPALPSPTPVPVTVSEAQCYGTVAGELWCFMVVHNENAFAVESVTGVVQLLDFDGEALAVLEAVPGLNLLDAGAEIPLVAYSAQPPDGWVSAQGQLLSSYQLPETGAYYIGAALQQTDVDISANGLSARVLGEVALDGGATAGEVWVLAVAYDAAGDVVGVSRWEREATENEFYFWVYSLGPAIERVEMLVEARP